jgi:hypothetical protein
LTGRQASKLPNKQRNMGQVLRRLLEVFYTKKLDIVVIGLENRWVIVCILDRVESNVGYAI